MTFPVHERRAVGVAPNVVWDVDTLSWVRMTQPVVNADVVNVDGQVEVIGPLTDDELRATPVPVSGTFYPATQPVSGDFYPATQPVSGTFWPATQPVSATALPLPSGASSVVSDEQLFVVLRQLLGAMRDPVWLDVVSNALKITGTISGAVTISSGTVTTVTGVTNIGGYPADRLSEDIAEVSWGATTRSLLV